MSDYNQRAVLSCDKNTKMLDGYQHQIIILRSTLHVYQIVIEQKYVGF